MKYLWIVVAFFLIQEVRAQTIIVGNVKVSVKADSAASAREQALDQAHQIAFQKLLNEHFPERASALPSPEVLGNMVSDFSIDREKATPTSYTASLTFQFDEPQVIAWVQQIQHISQDPHSLPLPNHSYESSKPLKIIATYATHSEWQFIRKTLENFPGVQNLSLSTLSPKNANLEIIYRGSTDQLEQNLLQKGILLSQQEGNWIVTSNGEALH